MHELFLIKVPETLDSKAFIAPITIMTRFPMSIKKGDQMTTLHSPVFSYCTVFFGFIFMFSATRYSLSAELTFPEIQ